MSNLYRRIDIPLDEPVQFVGVHPLKWPRRSNEPDAGFREVDIEDIQRFVEAIARAEAAEKQLAEAQTQLDDAKIGGIYDTFASIPDAVYQMARYIKEQGRKLVDAQTRIVELEGQLAVAHGQVEDRRELLGSVATLRDIVKFLENSDES